MCIRDSSSTGTRTAIKCLLSKLYPSVGSAGQKFFIVSKSSLPHNGTNRNGRGSRSPISTKLADLYKEAFASNEASDNNDIFRPPWLERSHFIECVENLTNACSLEAEPMIKMLQTFDQTDNKPKLLYSSIGLKVVGRNILLLRKPLSKNTVQHGLG